MSLILTFLGEGESDRTTIAIASAKKLAQTGSKVLLATEANNLSLLHSLGITPSFTPSEIENNFSLVQLSTNFLLEKNWEEIKVLEKKYLQSPVLQSIYGQELPVLPGMDGALILNALREYDKAGQYDVIIYDGTGDLRVLRILAMPEMLGGYVRRFRSVINDSDLGKIVIPLIQPILGTIFNSSWNWENISQSAKENEFLEEGRKAVSDPKRVASYLITTDDPVAVKTAKYLWGSAQLAGVTVTGVLLKQEGFQEEIASQFLPLPVVTVPQSKDWSTLVQALPDLRQTSKAPLPLEIDESKRLIKVFLPGFEKKQVKLTQQKDIVTLEAGDQRRNIPLSSTLKGSSVTGAKFHESYLIISF
jgi:anion-transporting  ArsA/GET3 family ATPase